jgi:hypothetical protein
MMTLKSLESIPNSQLIISTLAAVPLPPGDAFVIFGLLEWSIHNPRSQRSSGVPVMNHRIVLVPLRVQIDQSLHLVNGPISGMKN